MYFRGAMVDFQTGSNSARICIMSINYFQQSRVEQISVAYTAALKAYLTDSGEDALRQAYELGRESLRANLGILDMTELHHQAIRIALQNIDPSLVEQQIKNAMVFFEESLSPFEITHRGYRDAVEIIRRVANFAFIASHEIKAPITSIHSSASMLSEILGADRYSTEGRLIANIIDGVLNLKSRTDDMMDMVGLYTGALSVQTKLVDPCGFLRQVFEHLEPEVRSHGMKLNLRISERLPQVQFDPQRIEQVITNLVQNAVKYAADGGYIEMSASIRTDHLLFRVGDRGRGLPIHEQDLLLATNAPMGRDAHAQGTGLGLMLCQQIIEAHHGAIKLVSRKGQGSIFEIQLPLDGQPSPKD